MHLPRHYGSARWDALQLHFCGSKLINLSREEIVFNRRVDLLFTGTFGSYIFFFVCKITRKALKAQENPAKAELQDLHPHPSKTGDNFAERGEELLRKKEGNKTEPQKAPKDTSLKKSLVNCSKHYSQVKKHKDRLLFLISCHQGVWWELLQLQAWNRSQSVGVIGGNHRGGSPDSNYKQRLQWA